MTDKMVNVTRLYREWKVYSCPFCGSAPQVWAVMDGDKELQAQIRCSGCGASGGIIDRPPRRDPRTGAYNHDRPGAIALTLWGRRANPSMGRMPESTSSRQLI